MSRPRVVVLGLVARWPMAGMVWQALHYLLPLQRLGVDAWYVEDLGAPLYAPRQRTMITDPEPSARFLGNALAQFGLGDRWALRDPRDGSGFGLPADELEDLLAGAHSIWNLCGAARIEERHQRGDSTLVYVQTDPLTEQIRAAEGDLDLRAQLERHPMRFTYGPGILDSEGRCPAGLAWTPTRPPVLTDLWATGPAREGAAWNTLGTWRNEGKDVVWQGKRLRWSKDAGFRALADVPRRAGVRAQMAVAPDRPEELGALRRGGWEIADPVEISADINEYRRFIQDSRGEITPAKPIYVDTGSGWFSDRAVCYLAAGRPVLTPSTGEAGGLPFGEGLVALGSSDEAVAALRDINGDWDRHSRRATEIANTFFDGVTLVGEMLERIDFERARKAAASPAVAQSSVTWGGRT